MTPNPPEANHPIDSQAVDLPPDDSRDDLFDCPPERLLGHPRVVAVYRCLVGDTYLCNHGSLADVAFEMRDMMHDIAGMEKNEGVWRWLDTLGMISRPILLSPEGSQGYALRNATPAHWIIAATLAWEEGQKLHDGAQSDGKI